VKILDYSDLFEMLVVAASCAVVIGFVIVTVCGFAVERTEIVNVLGVQVVAEIVTAVAVEAAVKSYYL
jgi:hypothetical protein